MGELEGAACRPRVTELGAAELDHIVGRNNATELDQISSSSAGVALLLTNRP